MSVFAYIFVSSVLFYQLWTNILIRLIEKRFTEIMRCNLSYDFIIENNYVLFVNKIPFFMILNI